MASVFTPFPREEFRTLVESLLDDIPVIWDGCPVPFVGPRNGRPGTILSLDVKRVKKIGKDRVRKTWNPQAAGGQGAFQLESGGQRLYFMLFKVKSFSFDVPGYDPLEDLRLKFRCPSTLAVLQSMNVAFVDAGDVIPIDFNTDNRPEFAAVCEFQFAFAASQAVTDDPGGVIETVNGGVRKVSIGDIPFTPTE